MPSSLFHNPAGFWWDKDTGLFVQWGNTHIGDQPGPVQTRKFAFAYGFDTPPFIVVPVITEYYGANTYASTISVSVVESSISVSGFTASFCEWLAQTQNFGVRWIAVGYRVTPM